MNAPAPDTYPAPVHGWTCFHCGETFPSRTMEDQRRARDHFGADPDRQPGCLMRIEPGEERGLLARVRRLEKANDLLRREAEDEFCSRYYARVAADIRHIGPAFRECRDFRDVFNAFDSMEGRALAAEEQVASWKAVAHDHSERLKALAPTHTISYQRRVHDWMIRCFGATIAVDTVERNHRFLEEATELVQSLGCTWEAARQVVDYVFARDVGEPSQEVGGVMVTLAALCSANALSLDVSAQTELARVWTCIDKIRAKQAAKPRFTT